jgi:Nif-specific regulatory protein
LIAIGGPQEGQIFPLRGECFTIGRQADNHLQLASLEVSRHHCALRRGTGLRYTVVDLESRHGVLVNNRPIRERRLAHSDIITVGTSVLLFLLDDSSAATTDPPISPKASRIVGSTVAMKASEILYLDHDRLDAALPTKARIARDLHALLRVSSALQGPKPQKELAENLLTHTLEAIPAERASVLLATPGVDGLATIAVRGRDGNETTDFDLSPTLLAQIARDKVGVLCECVPVLENTGTRAATTNEFSLLCAPLIGHDGEVLGVVCGDSRTPGAFDKRHLELLGAITGMASLAFQNALHLHLLEDENRRLREHQLQHDMVGESALMQRLFNLIARVAQANTTVLVRGESGTGKELAAQAIHHSSPRVDKPFVAINCATLSQTLLESELFGHEKGAFTGAVERKIGKRDAAQGGTLFLDEVGEIPLTLQAKLLRVLQEREFERVGGTRPIQVDIRVVAATNRDLEAAIRDGKFREDLYYRLKVITLETPPLRQRRDDIPLLTSHFIAVHSRHLGRRGVSVSPAARRSLMSYSWPGNIRELGNVIERALVLGETDVIHPEDLPDEVLEGAPTTTPSGFQTALVEYKAKLVLHAWRKAGGDYGAAADVLGIHVNSLHRMISRLGIKNRLI